MRNAGAPTGVVHQNVELAKFLVHPIHHRFHLRGICNVGADRNRRAPGRSDARYNFLGSLARLAIVDRNFGAFTREYLRYRTADAGASARDQRYPILEFHLQNGSATSPW